MFELIHMTSAYSNAVLVAILPHVSDVARKLDLPVDLPVTTNQVRRFNPLPRKDLVGGGLGLTNRYWFVFEFGAVEGFRSPDNWFAEQDIVNLERYVGKDNMTTNEAIELARDSLRKLGYDPKEFHADHLPTSFEGPCDTRNGHIPFCRIEWSSPEARSQAEHEKGYRIQFDIDMQRKQVVGMDLAGRPFWRPPPKIDVEVELETDYRKRMKKENPNWRPATSQPQASNPPDNSAKAAPMQFKGTGSKMFVRTNAPPRLPSHAGPLPSATGVDDTRPNQTSGSANAPSGVTPPGPLPPP
jgi:hypothetical protein